MLADSPCNLEGNERDRNLLLPFFRLFGELLPRDFFNVTFCCFARVASVQSFAVLTGVRRAVALV